MKKLILMLAVTCGFSTVQAMNLKNVNDATLVGYGMSTGHASFARILGTVTQNHADLTILTTFFPQSISAPLQTTASVDIDLTQPVCASGTQQTPMGTINIYVNNCVLETLYGVQVLHGTYWTEHDSIPLDSGIINIDYPF